MELKRGITALIKNPAMLNKNITTATIGEANGPAEDKTCMELVETEPLTDMKVIMKTQGPLLVDKQSQF